jgi:hypothetical protein
MANFNSTHNAVRYPGEMRQPTTVTLQELGTKSAQFAK